MRLGQDRPRIIAPIIAITADVLAHHSVTSVLSPRVREQVDQPFRYRLLEAGLPAALEADLLAWLESDAPWRLVETDFYEQHEFSLLHVDVPVTFEPLIGCDALSQARRLIEDEFDCQLTERVELVAHKLVPGQRIAIHNDHLPGQETHRLTVQLNRGLSDDDGGFFMLFNSCDASDIHRILRPVSNTAIAFEISEASHHAVSRLHGGERYTLVYSFHAVRSRD